MAYKHADLIRRTYRDEVAHRHVVAISRFHRIQASPGFRAAADYVVAQLVMAGVQVAVKRYPADGVARFWSTPSFLEWTCDDARLALLDERGEASETLCDFSAVPISLIQRSVPVDGEFAVVALGGKGGKDEADYEGVDVAGKLVLTNAPVAVVQEYAVRRRGAAGILFDGMKAGGRSELDLPDARQYTSFWWAGQVQPDGWGFVVSPRQGQTLRAALADGKPVRVRAKIVSRFYKGSFEVVEGFIPGSGESDQEVLLVSHLCHPQPGAHDNGSGAAALIETAATLARLIRDGSLPPPQPRHPLHLAAGDDRHLRLAGRARGRCAGWPVDRRAESRHGGRGSVPDRQRLATGRSAAGGRGVRRSPAGLAPRAFPGRRNLRIRAEARRLPPRRDPLQRRLRPLHPGRSDRRRPVADADSMAGQVLSHLGGHPRPGERRQLGAQRRAGRGICRVAGDGGRTGGRLAGAPDVVALRHGGGSAGDAGDRSGAGDRRRRRARTDPPRLRTRQPVPRRANGRCAGESAPIGAGDLGADRRLAR